METRKQKEIEYYDRHAEQLFSKQESELATDFEGFDPMRLSSYRFCYDYLRTRCRGKKILDYGCGNGNHATFLAKQGGEVIAIDLSEQTLAIAKKRAERAGAGEKITFISMDCEKMQFADNSFDVIFDGGTFSSLDLDKAMPELARVLRPDGTLIGIETFGHNPITNLKRKLNEKTGKRTEWAASHIFSLQGHEIAGKYFGERKLYYFHAVSWAAIPFLKFPGGELLLKIMEFADRAIFVFPFLRKYAFKVVFAYSKPIK